MIYTEEIASIVMSVPNRAGLFVDIVEYETEPPFLSLRFYSSQWYTFNDETKFWAAMYLKELKESIEAAGIDVTLEPVDGAPDDENSN